MMGPFQAIRSVYWDRIFTCNGRSSRSEYWWCALIIGIFDIFLGIYLERQNSENLSLIVWLIFGAYTLCGGVCVSIRRLHDIGKSGYWLLLGLIPLIGAIVLLIMFCFPSKPEENIWGHPPNIKALNQRIPFNPDEVKATIIELQVIMERFSGPCWKIIQPDIVELIQDREKTIISIRENGMEPKHLAMLLTTNVIGMHVQSGQYHIYRGILGTIGEDMVRVWNLVQEAMKIQGYISESDVVEDNKWLEEQIAMVG